MQYISLVGDLQCNVIIWPFCSNLVGGAPSSHKCIRKYRQIHFTTQYKYRVGALECSVIICALCSNFVAGLPSRSLANVQMFKCLSRSLANVPTVKISKIQACISNENRHCVRKNCIFSSCVLFVSHGDLRGANTGNTHGS